MPMLVSIAGPLSGSVFPLPEAGADPFSIGRAANSTLCIEDPSVSRNHCSINRRGEHFIVNDRGSVNRTYINGLPLAEHTLRNGDEIKVGESLFLFVAEGSPAASQDEAAANPGAGIHLASTQVVSVPDSIRFSSDIGKYFDSLLKVGEAIPSAARPADVATRILDSLCGALPAEHGVLTVAGPSGEMPSVTEWSSQQASEGIAVSPNALLDKMMRDPAPVLWSRSAGSRNASAPAIAAGPRVTSLLAVPLLAFERFVGAMALTTSDPQKGFDEDHLRFLNKAAGLAAALLDDAYSTRNRETEIRQRGAANLEHNMVGESPRMRRLYDTIAKVAPTDSTVLIRGESGTGKELAAHAVHRNSLRAAMPFVAINCAAITETLLESELFGHEKGAFTGAVSQKKGKLEEANGGTVFFDEVTEMSPTLQAKLLRVLQEREFERVGGTRPIRTDVRILAATNRDLEEAIRLGAFRADLYYRLNVVSLHLPPLRDRRDDIEPLANHFAHKHSRKLKKWITGITPPALALLRAYDWPGNVRELENAIERALVLGSADRVQPEDLPDSVVDAGNFSTASPSGFNASITEAKKRLILETLQRTQGNHAEAARLLDLHPNSLHRIIRNLNLKPPRAEV
jgi:transcriptional regulator with GAF, ATPase, and Fis domain